MDTFPDEHIPTMHDTFTKLVTIKEGEVVNLVLLDTSGDKLYQNVRPVVYDPEDIFVICFSMDDANSLQNILTTWLPEIKAVTKSRKPTIVLVGTKSDVVKAACQQEDIEKVLAACDGSAFHSCSSKDSIGISQIFEHIVDLNQEKAKRHTRRPSLIAIEGAFKKLFNGNKRCLQLLALRTV